MRGYAGLAKDAVHIGGSVYDKNDAVTYLLNNKESNGIIKNGIIKINRIRFLFCLNEMSAIHSLVG